MKLLHIQKRDNVEFYLCCKFQLSPFSVRRKTDVKDGVTNKQTDKRTTVCLRPRHKNVHAAFTIGCYSCMYYASCGYKLHNRQATVIVTMVMMLEMI